MIKKSYERNFEESPRFNYENPELAVGGSDVISWETKDSRSQKYLPFNFTRIVNNGEDDIWFVPNQDSNNKILVIKGTIISLDRSSLPAVSSFKIENAGTNIISASKIIITNSREGVTGDSVVERLHKRLLGRQSSRLI